MRKGIVFSIDALAAFMLLTVALGAFGLMRGSFVSPMVENVGIHAVAQDAVSVLAKVRVYDVRHDAGV